MHQPNLIKICENEKYYLEMKMKICSIFIVFMTLTNYNANENNELLKNFTSKKKKMEKPLDRKVFTFSTIETSQSSLH